MINFLAKSLRKFRKSEDGTVAIEAVITLPIFLFCVIGIYGYWDAFRSMNTSTKAAYTISDLISRESRPVTANYLVGMQGVMQYLVGDDMPVSMRITSVTYSGVRKQNEVLWSRSPGNKKPALTTVTLQALKDKIPTMSDGDSIMLVETWATYTPVFNNSDVFAFFLDEQVFEQFVVTRPRFVPKVCLDGVSCT